MSKIIKYGLPLFVWVICIVVLIANLQAQWFPAQVIILPLIVFSFSWLLVHTLVSLIITPVAIIGTIAHTYMTENTAWICTIPSLFLIIALIGLYAMINSRN